MNDNKYAALNKSLLYLVKRLVKSGVNPERIHINLSDWRGAQVVVKEELVRCPRCRGIMEAEPTFHLGLCEITEYRCVNCKSTLRTELRPSTEG
jgi:tRNA(Ile2) C34 agmatinyltransferase TiaS